MKLDCVRCNKCGKVHSVEKGCDLPEAGASAERISSVVRSGADIEDTMLKVIQERDYLIEQLYKIYQHKDWLNMPDIVKEAVIFGLEKVSIKDGEEE